jgi:ATP-dependent helicase HepA
MFKVGQRWVSENEPELGLGLVQEVNKFQVHLVFPVAEETRIFSTETPPLKRVLYKVGDVISSSEGISFQVEYVEEEDGLLVYRNCEQMIAESDLAESSNFSNPEERILQGQVDSMEAFALRYQTIEAYSEARRSPVAGFLGGRIDLIPHQLFIANEVSARFCPRVLLADEVGLGKTIEACLVLHRLHLTGRASRILIIVPESLVHQWFVELYRRFNHWFAIMDADRCAAAMQNESRNPFLEEQLVLCSIETLIKHERWAEAITSVEWDLLVVDEAHHYEWSPEKVSEEYAIIEKLSKHCAGLILLTATPEQMGIEGHFARLRLLDANRYPKLEDFIEEHSHYNEVAKVADLVFQKKALTKKAKTVLKDLLFEVDSSAFEELLEDRDKLLEALVDRHGTGRVIFRNTRKALKGFPKRKVISHVLEASEHLSEAEHDTRLREEFHKEYLVQESEESLSQDYKYLFKHDRRIQWLAEFLKGLKGEKMLLICRSKEKVEALQSSLLEVLKVDSAVFHEDLSLIQRDRNAAYFADNEGAQILLCSEIGSEGRNFQFAHHLVLFDLPLNPELLEQRIGRLDRIGQTNTIQIHVPYFKESWTEILFKWHHESLNGMENSLKGGHLYYEANKERLLAFGEQLMKGTAFSKKEFGDFLIESGKYSKAMEQSLGEGQDRLVAINSNRPNKAKELVDLIGVTDKDSILESLMHQLFDFFGVTVERLDAQKYFIKPEHLYTESFPNLPEEGMTLSFNRKAALSREDLAFLTWDHPMVRGAIDLMVGGDFGNAGIVRFKEHDAKISVLFIECIFILESVAPVKLHVDRFLPPLPVRVLVDISGKNISELLSMKVLQSKVMNEAAFHMRESPELLRSLFPKLLESAQSVAEKGRQKEIKVASGIAKDALGKEYDRLFELKKVNANVSERELEVAEKEQREVLKFIEQAQLRMDSVRLVLNQPSR